MLAIRDDPGQRKAATFARCMVEAEGMYAAKPRTYSDCQQLVRKLEEALRFGLDQEYLRSRMQAVQPAKYRVTINNAVILPFKPGNKKPWDGIGGAMQNADSMLKSLGELAELSQVQTALVTQVLKFASGGTADPDCFLIVTIGGQQLTTWPRRDENDLNPSWEFPIVLQPTNAFDPAVMSIQVRDADMEEHDNVGAFQVPLGDLIKEPGVRTFTLFDAKGNLSAGGILSCTITTERL